MVSRDGERFRERKIGIFYYHDYGDYNHVYKCIYTDVGMFYSCFV